MVDVFDEVAGPDIFDEVSKPDVFDDTSELINLFKAELKKIRLPERVIYQPVHLQPKVIKSPPQIIKETRVEVQVEKKDPEKYADEETVKKLNDQIEELKKELGRVKSFSLGGSGVIGIPAPEPNPDNYVLTVDKGKAKWKAASGGQSTDVYTTSNVTTTRTLDPTTSSIDNLYNVLASLIVSLQGAGVIK